MGKLSFGKMLDCLYLSPLGGNSCSCLCINTLENEDEFEEKPLVESDKTQQLRLKDIVAGKQTLAFQLKPKVMAYVSVHSPPPTYVCSYFSSRKKEKENFGYIVFSN